MSLCAGASIVSELLWLGLEDQHWGEEQWLVLGDVLELGQRRGQGELQG